ncbi:MAG: hypothetical protein IT160_00785 [Bryobacterales bacterium]|nr:hypothetical protein [Bryobacterales bacterium]
MQIAKWRKAALEQLAELLVDGRSRKGRIRREIVRGFRRAAYYPQVCA